MNNESLEALNYFLEKQDNLEKYGSSGSFNIKEQRQKLSIIEKDLKDYYEIKKASEYYHWEEFAHDVWQIDTDRKWQIKFNCAICDVQADYRKARAFDIVNKKDVNIGALKELGLELYNKYAREIAGTSELTQEEYDSLKKELL